jgi:hypothetical protein
MPVVGIATFTVAVCFFCCEQHQTSTVKEPISARDKAVPLIKNFYEVIQSNSQTSMSYEAIDITSQQPEIHKAIYITTNQEIKTTSQHSTREKNLKTDE